MSSQELESVGLRHRRMRGSDSSVTHDSINVIAQWLRPNTLECGAVPDSKAVLVSSIADATCAMPIVRLRRCVSGPTVSANRPGHCAVGEQ